MSYPCLRPLPQQPHQELQPEGVPLPGGRGQQSLPPRQHKEECIRQEIVFPWIFEVFFCGLFLSERKFMCLNIWHNQWYKSPLIDCSNRLSLALNFSHFWQIVAKIGYISTASATGWLLKNGDVFCIFWTSTSNNSYGQSWGLIWL